MKGIHLLVFYMLDQIKAERSEAGCFHILNGRKSSQAIQDAFLFGFKSWQGLFPHYERSSFDQLISEGYEQKQLKKEGKGSVLTKQGREHLYQELHRYDFEQRAFRISDGPSHPLIVRFWQKFQLISQVISYSLYRKKEYQPVIQNLEIQHGVKTFWYSIKDKESFVDQFVFSIRSFLEQVEDELLVHLFIDKLSGYGQTGKTVQQLAIKYELPEALLQLYLIQMIRMVYLYLSSLGHAQLNRLIDNDQPMLPLTRSSQQTFQLLQKGYSMEEISQTRGLKLSTIEDHIIEIAAQQPDFDISPFLSDQLLQQVIRTQKELGTTKLSHIKQGLEGKMDYFQIRLALIKGGMKKNG